MDSEIAPWRLDFGPPRGSKTVPGGLWAASWRLLGNSEGLLGALVDILRRLGVVSASLGRHVGSLEALKAKMLIFHWFYKVLAAQLVRHVCQQHRKPKPWRG